MKVKVYGCDSLIWFGVFDYFVYFSFFNTSSMPRFPVDKFERIRSRKIMSRLSSFVRPSFSNHIGKVSLVILLNCVTISIGCILIIIVLL